MRVLIAEDQVLLRTGLVRLFTDAGHEVPASYGDAEGVPAGVVAHHPDLVVLDVRMPPTHTDEGTRAARALKEAHPGLGVLVLSQQVETAHVVTLVALGGFGYLLKDRVLDVAEFLAAAERVARGGSALDPEVVGALLSASGPAATLRTLSSRERAVLGLMAEGLSNTAIASRLTVSERTVEGHVSHVMSKLELVEDPDGHRRVLAVLAHLRAKGLR